MNTAGPRASSPDRVAMKPATRSGRLSEESLSMVPGAAHGDVPSVDAHDESSAPKGLEHVARTGAVGARFGGDVVLGGVAESIGRVPGATFAVRQRSHDANVVAALQREGESVPLE